MANYKRLTLSQRYLIQTLHHQQHGQEYIANQVGVSQSTICRELAKYKGQHPHQLYQAPVAQQRASQALQRTPYKLKGKLFATVLQRIRDRLSPEQVCGELEQKSAQRQLHHETIYRYIYRHKQCPSAQPIVHEELTQYLRIRHRKKYKDRSKPAKRELIPNRVSIDLRPAIVHTNTEIGHWEADTVIGKGHEGVLLTAPADRLVERRTKYVLIVKLPSKHARALSQAAVKALRKCGLPVKTITFDNGLEFACHEYIGQQLGAATYFAHPYHSWERGLNENTNAGRPVPTDPSVHSQVVSD
jgi:transposase, IS30 family